MSKILKGFYCVSYPNGNEEIVKTEPKENYEELLEDIKVILTKNHMSTENIQVFNVSYME